MEKNKIKFGILAMFLLFTIVLSLNGNAAGVSSPYWDDNPMYVQPGEIKEFNYLLQNMVGNDDLKVQAILEGDINIIQLSDSNNVYDVPLGKSDVAVKVRITVPKDAKEGDEWQVGVRFTTLVDNTEGRPLSIGTAFSKGFKVIVGKPQQTQTTSRTIDKETKSSFNQLTGFVILVAVLMILLYLLRYFHKKRQSQ